MGHHLWILMVIPVALALLAVALFFMWILWSPLTVTEVKDIVLRPQAYVDRTYAAGRLTVADINVQLAIDRADAQGKAQLDHDAHVFALKHWCTSPSIGGTWKATTMQCLLGTQETCESQSNLDWRPAPPKTLSPADQVLFSYNQKPYLEFHPDANDSSVPGYCFEGTRLSVRRICDTYDLPYYGAQKLECQDTERSICGYADGEHIPTCELPDSACKKKGLSHDNTPVPLGDCYLDSWQAIVEMIFGKTLTRQYRQAFQTLYHSCQQHGAFSTDCFRSVLNVQFLADKIAVDTAKAFVHQRVAAFKQDCRKSAISQATDVLTCMQDTLSFFPPYYLSGVADKMIVGLLDVIGIKLGVGRFASEAVHTLHRFANKAFDAVKRYGAAAAESIERAGAAAINAIDRAGQALGEAALSEVEDLANAAVAVGERAARTVVQINKAVAAGGMYAANVIHNLADRAGDAAIVIAQAFEQGTAALGNFVATQLADFGSEALQDLGSALAGRFPDAMLTAFGRGLSGFVGVGVNIASIGSDIASGIASVASSLGNAIGSLFREPTDGADVARGAITAHQRTPEPSPDLANKRVFSHLLPFHPQDPSRLTVDGVIDWYSNAERPRRSLITPSPYAFGSVVSSSE